LKKGGGIFDRRVNQSGFSSFEINVSRVYEYIRERR